MKKTKKNKKNCCPDCNGPLTRFATYEGVYAEVSCPNDYCVSYGQEQNQEALDREDMFLRHGDFYQDGGDDDY